MSKQMTMKAANALAGVIGFPSKMPGTSYGIGAEHCITGSKLATVPGSVCHGCYALDGNYQYPSVKVAHARREANLDHPMWIGAMVRILRQAQQNGKNRQGEPIQLGFHRWHDSGDLQSVEHLSKICEVARQTPDIRHWLPTREVQILAQYRKQGGTVPSNLLIRVSATMVDGAATKTWSHTSTVHKDKAPQGHVCPAPTQDNACGACRACWSPAVANVSYHLH
jgi:Gene product 88